MILHPPYIKPKGFLNAAIPIVHKGIPAYADSKSNPKVIGTPAWEEFWNEELYKIINGVQIGGVYLPGRFYYYMNYKHMSTIKGVITPDFVDMHLEFCLLIEYAKSQGKNILCGKGRRKGVSEEATTVVPDYGWRFSEGYKGGVAAGNKKYVDDFIAKWRFADSRLPPELAVKKLTDNDNEIIAGYAIKNRQNAYEDRGTMNTLYMRTMHTNPNMFKGLYLNDVIVEEVGEFEKFLEFYSATKDCLMSGNKQSGMMLAFGTGGNVNKGSKDFKKVWKEADSLNFIRFLIPAQRFYFYGGATEDNRKLPLESELYKQYKPYELIGVEDVLLSKDRIMEERAKFLKEGDIKAFNEHKQNNPIDETEIFAKTSVNNFDTQKLIDQNTAIMIQSHPRYTKYRLEWVKDDKTGMIKMPLAVNRIPLKPYEDQNICVWMLDGGEPKPNFTNRFCAGIDSYNIDTSKVSKSLGAMLVLDRQTKTPVATICCRPKRKEIFFEMCIMLSVHYKMYGNVLGDVASDTIMKHFEQHSCYSYLADRPKKFESEGSEQSHEKWVRLTPFAKTRMIGVMQAHITDFCQEIWFPELLEQVGNYDEVEIGSDNDLADAYGIALMQDICCEIRPRNEDDNMGDKRYALPKFVDDGNGGLKLVKGGSSGGGVINPEADGQLFKDIFGL